MELLIGAALALLAQVTKEYIYPKFGDWGVHGALFLIALVGTAIWQTAVARPELMAIIENAGTLLVSAVGVYEVILKRLGALSAKDIIQNK